MSDDQVNGELRKMTAFIKQEAQEKAREIEVKANEEFSMEKSKLVRSETDSIDATYAKKFKQATMSQQITRSTVSNKTRLKVLGARQELLDDIFEAAAKKLADATKDKSKYQTLLKDLILEGAYAMGEKEIAVQGRKADYGVLKDAVKAAEKEYKEKAGNDTTISIDESSPLAEESAGGVIIVSGSGKIDINNTLEERLELLKSTALPAVRETLFGKNANRKYYD